MNLGLLISHQKIEVNLCIVDSFSRNDVLQIPPFVERRMGLSEDWSDAFLHEGLQSLNNLFLIVLHSIIQICNIISHF